MNRTVLKTHIAVPAERIPYPGKIRALASSSCPAFFSADVTIKDNVVHIYYSTGEFLPLKDAGLLIPEKALMVMKTVVHNQNMARDWMWYPEEYVLSDDTVWVDSAGSVRFLWIPDSIKQAGHRSLYGLAEQMKSFTSEEGKEVLTRLQQNFFLKPCLPQQILSGIDRMMMELREYSSYSFIK